MSKIITQNKMIAFLLVVIVILIYVILTLPEQSPSFTDLAVSNIENIFLQKDGIEIRVEGVEITDEIALFLKDINPTRLYDKRDEPSIRYQDNRALSFKVKGYTYTLEFTMGHYDFMKLISVSDSGETTEWMCAPLGDVYNFKEIFDKME